MITTLECPQLPKDLIVALVEYQKMKEELFGDEIRAIINFEKECVKEMIIYREETLIIPKDGHTTHDEIWEYFKHEIDVEAKSVTGIDDEKCFIVKLLRKLTP